MVCTTERALSRRLELISFEDIVKTVDVPGESLNHSLTAGSPRPVTLELPWPTGPLLGIIIEN